MANWWYSKLTITGKRESLKAFLTHEQEVHFTSKPDDRVKDGKYTFTFPGEYRRWIGTMSRTYIHDNVLEGEVLPDGRVTVRLALSQANTLDQLELLVIARRYELDIEARGRDNTTGDGIEFTIVDGDFVDVIDVSFDMEEGKLVSRKSRFAEEGDDG